MEEIVVIVAIALLVAVSLPAVRSFIKSIESGSGGARAMINAALAAARATAAQQQRYAGIRFQHAYDPNNSVLKAPQYMIFIVYDFDATGLANGFRAVEGVEPIKLPDNVGVMEVVNVDSDIDNDTKLLEKTTFSVIFSPSGKMVIHPVLVINREGKKYSDNSEDDVFNSGSKVQDGIALFIQDHYYSVSGLDEEQSRNSFRIYDRDIFGKVNPANRVSDYLQDVDIVYINPYTGTIIDR
jgi:Tfp pilus assembly protein FimT